LTNGATAEGSAVSYDAAAFNCLPDYANANDSGIEYVLGAGHPLANAGNTPGALIGASSTFAICMGHLDENETDPKGEALGAITSVISIALEANGAADTLVTITADSARGGIVGDELGEAIDAEPEPFLVTFAECIKADSPMYADWVGAGKNWEKPDCWCYERQCRGDADGLKVGMYRVQMNDLGVFIAAFNKGDLKMNQSLICADFDHKKVGMYRVQMNDLGEFIKYFNKGDLKNPVCPTDWDADGDDDYNFWITP
jgi:hypothetical protein